MCEEKNAPWVIASGDEGLQLNSGCRLGFVGSGFALEAIEEAIKALQATFTGPLVITSTQEDEWLTGQLHSKNQAVFDETINQFAQDLKIPYAGQFDYGDPKDLEDGVRGHLVRPPKIHVAERICLTLGGGEQNYSLEQFIISADFARLLDPTLLGRLLNQQIEYYQHLLGHTMEVVTDLTGPLSEQTKNDNHIAVSAVVPTLS